MTFVRNLIPPPLLLFLATAAVWAGIGALDPDHRQPQSGVTEERQRNDGQREELPNSVFSPRPGDYGGRMATTLKRPLFSETRRQPESEPEAEIAKPMAEPARQEPEPQEKAAPPIPPALRYIGFISAQGSHRALLLDPESKREIWADKGDKVSGWTVSKITNTRVHLIREGFEHFINLNL